MKKLSILMLSAMLLAACQKENTPPKTQGTVTGSTGTTSQHPGTPLSSSATPTQLDGTYTGNFSLGTTLTAQVSNVPVQLKVAGNQFDSGDLSHYYSVGGGTVTVSGNALNFNDDEAFPDYLVSGSTVVLSSIGLTGSYDYKINGDSLLLSKTVMGVTSTYKLKK